VDGLYVYDVAIHIQNLSQCRHLHLQIALLHNGVGPYTAHDLFLGDQDAGRPDQHHQKIEGAAAELDGLSIDQQLASAWQCAKSAKPNDRHAACAYLAPTGARRIPLEDRVVRELLNCPSGGEGLATLEHYVPLHDCHPSDSLDADCCKPIAECRQSDSSPVVADLVAAGP
jgi:hypothetical protein